MATASSLNPVRWKIFGPRLRAKTCSIVPGRRAFIIGASSTPIRLKPFEALSKLGMIESTLCMLSFMAARLNPTPDPKTFEDWVTNQFGKRLFRIFFKTYTEKVWGMSCNEISADWAAQRIKGLSLGSAIKHALFTNKPKDRKQIVKTLIDTFRYPRLGPGMMWEACAEKVRKLGGEVLLGRRVVGCSFDSAANSGERLRAVPTAIWKNTAPST